MDQDILLAVWDAHLELLSRIAVESGLEAKGDVGSRIAAQIFSEALGRSTTLDSAAECMHSDPEGARSFVYEANAFNWLIYDRAQELPSFPTGEVGPFPFVRKVVTQMLDQLQQFDPANFD
jgi:hypothetical protein